MPTYEYRCSNCGHELEEFQSMSAKPLKKCPACGKNTLERLISGGGGILFKGGGFYETDYRSDAYTKAAKADSEAAKGKASDKADAKSDTSTSKSDTKESKGSSSPATQGKSSESSTTAKKPKKS